MCASLMNAQESSTLDLQEAIARKLKKFGAIEKMPQETRDLVESGVRELQRRALEESEAGLR